MYFLVHSYTALVDPPIPADYAHTRTDSSLPPVQSDLAIHTASYQNHSVRTDRSVIKSGKDQGILPGFSHFNITFLGFLSGDMSNESR